MYCIKCGAKLEDGAKFCTKCGASLSEEAFVNKAAPTPALADQTDKNAKKRIDVIQTVVSCILILFFLFMFIGTISDLPSVFFLIAAVVMLPITLWKRIIPKWYIRLLISFALFILAIWTLPSCAHEYSIIENVAPTCTEEGRIVKICSLCEVKDTERSKALGHEYIEISRSEPTENAAGEVVLECSRCGDKSVEVLEKLEESTKAEAEYLVRSVDELIDELDGNAYQAKETYIGKKLEITGRVGAIDASGKYITLLPINNEWEFIGAQCYIDLFDDEQKEWLSKFSVDDVVTLRGTVSAVGEIIRYQLTIDSFVKINDSASIAKFDAESVKKQLEVTEYSLNTRYSNYAFLVVKNNSEYTITVKATVKFYDESGALIGAKDDTQNALAGGSETVLLLLPDESFSKMEYELDVSEDKWYKSAVQDLSYKTERGKGKEVVSVTNNGSSSAMSVKGYALFFNGDELVGYSSQYFVDNEFELKAGKTVTKEMDCSAEYTSVQFYFSGLKE